MSKLLIPKQVFSDILMLVNASLEQLQALTEHFDSVEAVSPTSQKFLSKVSDILNISVEDAYGIVQLVNFLTLQKERDVVSDNEFITGIEEILSSKNEKDATKNISGISLQRVILALFGPKPVAELAKKKAKLETGLLKTLTKIEGTCELRPIFNLDRSHIVDKVITVTTRLTLEDDEENEKIVVFQLNDKSLKKLKDFIETTEKKIKIMGEEIKEHRENG